MKIGADPEFFIARGNGRWNSPTPVPAHRFLDNKNNKLNLGEGVQAFRDGYVVEINVPPATTVKDLARSVQIGLNGVSELLPQGLWLLPYPACRISLATDLADAPEDVLHFGCDPSYDAYTGREKSCRINAWEHEYRYAGGHMHFSVTPAELKHTHAWMNKKENHLLFIRMLDYRVGIPLTMAFKEPNQFNRRLVYGQAGEFRPQEYPDGAVGLEYRTPCPHIWHSLETATFFFETAMDIFTNFSVYAKAWHMNHMDKKGDAIRDAVNMGVGLSSPQLLAPELATPYEKLFNQNHQPSKFPFIHQKF